jgi:hypothetical protein
VRKLDALRARQRAVAPREDLRRRYEAALADAERAIDRFAAVAPLRTQWMVEGFRRDLEQYRTDFDDVRKGLDGERTRLEEQLVALKGLRDALLDQVRSFACRSRRQPRLPRLERLRQPDGALRPPRRGTPASSSRAMRRRSRASRWSRSSWAWASDGCGASSTGGSTARR